MSDTLRIETAAALAERLGLMEQQIVHEVVEGRLPYVNVGGHWRFRDVDVEHWLKHHGQSANLLPSGERQG